VQYGAAAAILLGDLLLGWADDMLRHCGFEPDHVAAGLTLFEQCRTEVIAGQFLDVSVQARGRADVETAMTVLRFKSAKYSIERPLHIGAALAGASDAQIAQLSRFGLPLGEAFQLRDDLLGVFGDPATTGKPAGDDLVEGKRTVLVALALDAAPQADAQRLDAALGTPLDEADVDDLRGIIDRSGAREQVESVIGELADRAVASLRSADIDADARGVLTELAAAATQRAVCPTSDELCHALDVRTFAPQQHREGDTAVRVRPLAQNAQRDAEGLRVGAGQGGPAVPEQHDTRRAGTDVVEAVGQGVEVLPVVVGEAERVADRGQELRLGAGRCPPVDHAEAPARVLDRVAYVDRVVGAMPPVDARGVVSGQQACQSAHCFTS